MPDAGALLLDLVVEELVREPASIGALPTCRVQCSDGCGVLRAGEPILHLFDLRSHRSVPRSEADGLGDGTDDPAAPPRERLSDVSRTASSPARPTKRENPRARDRSSRLRSVPTPASSWTVTGALTPFKSRGTRLRSSKYPWTRRA